MWAVVDIIVTVDMNVFLQSMDLKRIFMLQKIVLGKQSILNNKTFFNKLKWGSEI